MVIKYYIEESKAFITHNYIILLGVAVAVVAVFLGRAKFTANIKKRNAAIQKSNQLETYIHKRAMYAATQAVVDHNELDAESRKSVANAHAMQYKVAKLKLRVMPDILMDDLVRELNSE